MSVPHANDRPLLQGVSGMKVAAKVSVAAGEEGDGKVEEPVEGLGSTRRQEMRTGGAALPHLNGCLKAGVASG